MKHLCVHAHTHTHALCSSSANYKLAQSLCCRSWKQRMGLKSQNSSEKSNFKNAKETFIFQLHFISFICFLLIILDIMPSYQTNTDWGRGKLKSCQQRLMLYVFVADEGTPASVDIIDWVQRIGVSVTSPTEKSLLSASTKLGQLRHQFLRTPRKHAGARSKQQLVQVSLEKV